MARIFTSQTLSNGDLIELDAGASRHLAGALRMGLGDSFVLFNGEGGEYPATIESLSKKTSQ